MRLGVLASGNLGLQVLKELKRKYILSFVMTDGSSKTILEFCEENKISLFVGNPRNEKATGFIKNQEIDVLASINYLFLIEKELINLPKILAFNVHGSLLPKFRGRTPHVWAIINNEKETGITAHQIDEGCDTGNIIKQVVVSIHQEDTGASILKKFEALYPKLIFEVLNDIEEGTLNLYAQDHTKATFFYKRTPEDGQINWEWQKEQIYNWVRAQAAPYPGAFTFLEGEKVIVDHVSFSDFGFDSKQKNGEVIAIVDGNPIVKVSNGTLLFDGIRTLDFQINEKQYFANADC